MKSRPPRTIELGEYASTELDAKALSEESAIALWRTYAAQILVDFPSPKTGNKWILTPQGWVGQIPIAPNLVLRLNPKTKIQNIFGMLEYAYRLRQFLMPPGLIDAGDIEDVFERLAVVLSKRVVARARKGFYRAYVPKRENLSYLRGRLDIRNLSRSPWKVELPCRYSLHTADIEDNRILAWTLFLVARAGFAKRTQRSLISRAFRTLQGSVLLNQYGAESCVNRRYNRLNDDYESMHALCGFFLSHTGPTHHRGDNAMLPFLIDMSKLYESFVAEWLRERLPKKLSIKSQQRITLGERAPLFVVDLVLCDAFTGQPLGVLDTKYKVPERAAHEDIYQIVTYAKLMHCQEAILVYPTMLDQALDIDVGDVHVRSLTFALDGDLEEAGQTFLSKLSL